MFNTLFNPIESSNYVIAFREVLNLEPAYITALTNAQILVTQSINPQASSN